MLFSLKIIVNFNIKYFLDNTLLNFFYVTIMLLPLFFIPNILDKGLGRFLIVAITSIIWLIITVYFFGINKFEKEIFNQHLIKWTNKIKILIKK